MGVKARVTSLYHGRSSIKNHTREPRGSRAHSILFKVDRIDKELNLIHGEFKCSHFYSPLSLKKLKSILIS